MWKKHPFSEPGPLEAWLGATAPSGRFEHTEKRHNPFRQKGFCHAELARRRPSARPSLVGRIPAAKAETGPTYEVTTGLHRPRFKRVWTFPSAQNTPTGACANDPPNRRQPWRAPASVQNAASFACLKNCSCVKSRRKLLQRSTTAHREVLERIPSPNTAAQHGPIRKCQQWAQFAPRCAPKIRSAASNGRPC